MALVDPGFEDLQLNSGNFQKIMKNLKYWKTMFKTEMVKSKYQKDQIEQFIRIGFSVQTRADSEFTNPDPRQNDHINNS